MEIISHRGYWIEKYEKNTTLSFERSFSLGFGTETDIRDHNGNLVISHDIPTESPMQIDDFFKIYKLQSAYTLALNIKSDGLQSILKNKLEKYDIQNYFVFDMSIPDLIGYVNNNFKVFSRQSEYERIPVFYDKVEGIWLDSFNKEWYDINLIKVHLKNEKKIAIVSSELHGRHQMDLWEFIKNNNLHKEKKIILCTDFPDLATKYFNE